MATEAEKLQKEEQKRLKRERKEKLSQMTKEEKEAFLAAEQAERLAAYEEAEKAYAEKVAARKETIQNESGWKKFWFNFGQSGFCQWFRRSWSKFTFVHPELSKWVYQIFFFFVFSNGVTIWQYLVMLFLPNAFGLELAAIPFKFPAISLEGIISQPLPDGTYEYGVIFNEMINPNGPTIGYGLGNFLAFEIAVFTAQCINFPLQRNITFKSKGNPVVQGIWYFIGWVAISILVNAVWGLINIFMMSWGIEKAISDLLKTFITGGLSMFVFFFIFKIIFPEGEKKTETPSEN